MYQQNVVEFVFDLMRYGRYVTTSVRLEDREMECWGVFVHQVRASSGP